MATNDKTIEQRVEDLEKRCNNFKNSKSSGKPIRWDAVMIIGIWAFAAIMAFSPAGKEHFESVLGAAGVVTAFILFFD